MDSDKIKAGAEKIMDTIYAPDFTGSHEETLLAMASVIGGIFVAGAANLPEESRAMFVAIGNSYFSRQIESITSQMLDNLKKGEGNDEA